MTEQLTMREKKEHVVELLRERMDVIDVYQDRPWTFVKFEVIWNGERHEIFDFTKVCRPDKWDAQHGIDLATTKALYKLAKQIVAKDVH